MNYLFEVSKELYYSLCAVSAVNTVVSSITPEVEQKFSLIVRNKLGFKFFEK